MATLDSMLNKPEFKNMRSRLLRLVQPTIRITTARRPLNRLKLGTSRFGGLPDLPADFDWPQWRKRPMGFLAMLKLSQVQLAVADDRLPHTGFLYFWYDSFQEPWGFDPRDKGAFRVDYVPDEATRLQRAAIPKGYASYDGDQHGEPFRPCVLNLTATQTLPSFDEELDWTPKVPARAREGYGRLHDILRGVVADNGGHTLLGYPWLVQGPMRTECQYASNGVYCGDTRMPGKRVAAKLDPGIKEWVLLAQFDTDEEGPGWMWGDMGMLYFWIRRPDLAARRFDRVWGILQCS